LGNLIVRRSRCCRCQGATFHIECVVDDSNRRCIYKYISCIEIIPVYDIATSSYNSIQITTTTKDVDETTFVNYIDGEEPIDRHIITIKYQLRNSIFPGSE